VGLRVSRSQVLHCVKRGLKAGPGHATCLHVYLCLTGSFNSAILAM